jgi:stromal membrane-associated protein
MTHPPPPKAAPAPPKQTKPGDSLLGLDFFGPSAAQNTSPGRPSSASSNPQASTVPSRPDLKQSILSLYASAPRQQSQPQTQQPSSGSFSNPQSPAALQQQPQQSSTGGLNDAFSGLSFAPSSSTAPQTHQPKPSPFSNLGNFSSPRTASTQVSPPISGGGFFNTSSKSTPAAKLTQAQATQTFSPSSGFGAFNNNSPTGIKPTATVATAAPVPAPVLGDLFDFSSTSSPAMQPTGTPTTTPISGNSVFNLSAKPAVSQTQQTTGQTSTTAPASTAFGSGWANTDAWGSNEAWATPDTGLKHTITTSSSDSDWASVVSGLPRQSALPPPKAISADEDFGGWSSAGRTAPTPKAATPGKGNVGTSTGFVGSDDLFSNVWE